MRLFIAINFNSDTRVQLLAMRDELRSRSERGNFSLPENLHLTLAFLGECTAKQVSDANVVMDLVNFDPFDIHIERVGQFKRSTGDIWWVGVRGNKPLLNLQRGLTSKLIAAGYTLDRREYTPHITLGRGIVTDTSPWQIKPFGETVTAIELMKSDRIAGKLTYTAIHRREAR